MVCECDYDDDMERDYEAVKEGLLELLGKLDAAGSINEMAQLNALEGIFMWTVVDVVSYDQSGLDSDWGQTFITAMTERGDVHFRFGD